MGVDRDDIIIIIIMHFKESKSANMGFGKFEDKSETMVRGWLIRNQED